MVSVGLGSSTGKFWIGLSRPSTGAPYKWDDGTPLTWSNFNGARDGLYVAENVANGQWQSLGGKEILSFVCSYDPSSTHPTLPPPTSLPKPRVTCLFMIDLQSLGIEQKAISTYQSYYNFALLVASKLNDAAEFTGFLDSFGYSSGLMNHDTYPINSYADLISAPFPIDGTDDDIDLDLKDVDASLTTAAWVPPTKDQTCLIFFSAAPAAEYGGTTIKTTYDSFTTIIGVLLGNGVNSIPGLIDSIGAYSMSDADAQTVVQKLLESLP